MVKYCSQDCKIAHRPKHEKACKKRAAELYDEKLFKDPPKRGHCPICMLPLPVYLKQYHFQPCCGQLLCDGCVHAQLKADVMSGKREEDLGACPFCRSPGPTEDGSELKQLQKLVEKNNALAIQALAVYCYRGAEGFQKDLSKAIELYLKAGELGCVDGYFNLGIAYETGNGVEKDVTKARHYYELAAIGGSVNARYNVAQLDLEEGNRERASKHLLIGARVGDEACLRAVRNCFVDGFVTKDEYAEALRSYQKQQEDMKSPSRDEALEFSKLGLY